MSIMMGIAAAASIGGSMMGADAARSGRNASRRASEAAARAFSGIKIPTIEEQKIILNSPELAGQYTPEQIEAMQMGVSAMEQVKADPNAIRQQEDALSKISEVAEGGVTEGDKAAMRSVQRDVNQSDVARRKSILNNMAQRGVLGSGMELAAQLQGQQQSANAAAEASDRAIQQAQARSLQAMAQQGQMAGDLRSQGFREQSDAARAKDAITQFNLSNRQRVADTNTQERNRAQQAHLAALQSRENARVAAQNQMEMHNKGLQQTKFGNEIQRATGIANAYTGQATNAVKAGAAEGEMIGGIASGMANIFGGQAGQKKG